MKLLSLIFFVKFFILVNFCAMAQQNKLVFTPHWLPQAQFAGFYVALEKGYYADAGLDVEIIHPLVTENAIESLISGHADVITLFLVTGLKAKSEGIDLVNIAQLSQHSAIMMVSMKSSGIETIHDFQGTKIGIWMSGFEEVPRALINEYGLEVTWVPILSTVNLFLAGGIDIMTVMWYNEYHTIYLSGIDHDELNTFFLSDYGYDIPEDGLYALSSTMTERREDLRRFTEATMKGWEYAAANREEVISLVVDIMRKAHVPSNKAHQRWMLNRVLEMYTIDEKRIQSTELYLEDFNKAVSLLKKQHIIRTGCDYNVFFQPVMPGIR